MLKPEMTDDDYDRHWENCEFCGNVGVSLYDAVRCAKQDWDRTWDAALEMMEKEREIS